MRGCVNNPIAIFPVWNVLSRLLVTYSLKCLRWENGVYTLVQVLSINLRRLELALIPVDPFTLSLGSRSIVVYGEGSVDHGQIPWLPWAFSFHVPDEVATTTLSYYIQLYMGGTHEIIIIRHHLCCSAACSLLVTAPYFTTLIILKLPFPRCSRILFLFFSPNWLIN